MVKRRAVGTKAEKEMRITRGSGSGLRQTMLTLRSDLLSIHNLM